MTLKAVVLPAPFGPISPAISPFSTASDTWSSATRPPKVRVTCSTDRIAATGGHDPKPKAAQLTMRRSRAGAERVAAVGVVEGVLQLVAAVQLLELAEGRRRLARERRERCADGRDRAQRAGGARTLRGLDRLLDLLDARLGVARELVQGVLGLLPGVGVGLAEAFEVVRERR